jgi:hypothetical protein
MKGNKQMRRYNDLSDEEKARALKARIHCIINHETWPAGLSETIRQAVSTNSADSPQDQIRQQRVCRRIAFDYCKPQAETDCTSAYYPDAEDLIILLDVDGNAKIAGEFAIVISESEMIFDLKVRAEAETLILGEPIVAPYIP